jgi:hypothetical protein
LGVVVLKLAGDGDDALGRTSEDRLVGLMFDIEEHLAGVDLMDEKTAVGLRGRAEEALEPHEFGGRGGFV